MNISRFTRDLMRFDLISGECDGDGLYYMDEHSFIMCISKNFYLQPCPPGSMSRPYNGFNSGEEYAFENFCDINLVDFGYTEQKTNNNNNRAGNDDVSDAKSNTDREEESRSNTVGESREERERFYGARNKQEPERTFEYDSRRKFKPEHRYNSERSEFKADHRHRETPQPPRYFPRDRHPDRPQYGERTDRVEFFRPTPYPDYERRDHRRFRAPEPRSVYQADRGRAHNQGQYLPPRYNSFRPAPPSVKPFVDLYGERKYESVKKREETETEHPRKFSKLPSSEMRSQPREEDFVYMVVSMPRKLLHNRHDAGASGSLRNIEEQVRILGYHDTSGEYNSFESAI